MSPRLLLPIVAAGALLTGPVAAAPACEAASGAQIRPVVELFTSEGCDSCPPADRWFSASFADASAGAIPLAFHVDYWDRLGWKDRFASPLWTERQHHAADANRAGFVYTPQVLVQGREFSWRDARAHDTIGKAAQAPARARVEVAAERTGTGLRVRASARGVDGALPADATVSIAYVDSDLNSDVKAGENRGVRLHHDHVVRALVSGPAADAHGVAAAEALLTPPAEAGRDPAVVAFVQRARDGAILQAVTLPLTDCPPR
jgi:hypothetical protein